MSSRSPDKDKETQQVQQTARNSGIYYIQNYVGFSETLLRRRQTDSERGPSEGENATTTDLCVERERTTTKGSTSSKGATKEVWSQRRGKMTRAVRFKQADLLWNKEYFWNYYGARREMYSTRVIRALRGVSQVMSSNFDLVAEEKIESETVTKKWTMPLR